ncbi:MAG: DUF2953 domain-containing protein [Lachnospiraceae bacterium]|nr:DUF2953 domain-containing protein [Lachnospiraceae bacterium]
MLHVILQILSIIGIVLLCLLGLLLLLILLVLFVPIRYRMIGHKEGETLAFSARVTYLLHLLSVRFEYPKPGSLIIKVFGIRVFDSAKQKEQDAEENGGDKMPQKENGKNTADEKQHEENDRKEESLVKNNAVAEAAVNKGDNKGEEEGSQEELQENFSEDMKEKKSLTERIKDIFQKIQYTIRSICDKIKSSLQKAEELKETVTYYKDSITKQENRMLFGRAKKRLFKVLKSIRPRVLKADLHIGTGSPDTTGYLCAAYGMLSPVLGNNVRITPDFEETVWEGRVYIKGRITVFTILWQALGIILDKQLRIFIRELKREEK